MRKKANLLIVILPLFAVSFLSGCKSKNAFTITWKNYDGSILEKDNNVRKGETPSYDSKTPYRLDDDSNYYVFKGWSPELNEVKKDVTYTAQYDSFALEAVSESPDGYVDELPEHIKDGNIFHAFCWKFKDIDEKLTDIKNAGFKTVQISPVQQPKGGGAEWWAYYQPLSFSIADNSLLGTKSELQDMCTHAKALDVDVIADIVFNHMANISDTDQESDKTPKVFPGVETYEPYIYQHRNDSENPTFHHNPNAEGSGAVTQTYPYGGLPDLNTANEYVQERSLALLKECIDVGIDGFRFDAAKHIETPDDPQYPSNFWPNVLNPAKEYYKSLNDNKELYLYGEILGGPDGGRTIDIYTKMMNVCDDSYGTALRYGINGNGKAGMSKYGKSTNAENLVTWVESHDTFEHEKSHIEDEKIMRGFAISGTRNKSRSLYLSRTDDSATVGKIFDYSYESNILGAINRFHNRFASGDEYQFAQDSVYVNQLVKGDDKGAVIVDLKPDGNIVVNLDKLGTGVYYDQISGQSYTVRNGHLIINMPASGVVILTKSKNLERPTIEISSRGGIFVNEKSITIKTNSATTCSYSINGGAPVSFTNEVTFKIGEVVDLNNKVTLSVSASNAQFSISRNYVYQKTNLIPGSFNIINVNPDYFTNNEIYMWSWTSSLPGHWSKDYTVQDSIILVDTTGLAGMLLGLFEKGYTISNVNVWDANVLKQTTNIEGSILAQGYFDASDF